MKCKTCGAKIIIIPTEREDIWIHSRLPEGKTCLYSDEGISISVVDPLIQQKFKELNVKENWYKTPSKLFSKLKNWWSY